MLTDTGTGTGKEEPFPLSFELDCAVLHDQVQSGP